MLEGLDVVFFAVDAAGADGTAGLASALQASASESVVEGASVAGDFTVGTAPGVCMRLQVDMVLIDAAAGAGLVADGDEDAVELDVEVVVAVAGMAVVAGGFAVVEFGVAVVAGGFAVVEVAVAAVAEAGFEASVGFDEPGELCDLDEVEETGEVGEAVTPGMFGVVLLAFAALVLFLSATSLSSSLLFLSVDL